MQRCIYATDMARHMPDLKDVQAILEEIPAGTALLHDELDSEIKETRKSKFLELVVHASDISFLARP